MPQSQEQIKKDDQPEEQNQPQEQLNDNDQDQNQLQSEEQNQPQEQPNDNDQDQEEDPDNNIQEEYNNAFEDAFGKPSEDHTWGF